MTQMAPTRPYRSPVLPLPVARHAFRIPLLADLTAAASARAVIEDVIRAWRVPVDADVAVLLTSELMTNAVTHGTQETGEFVLLAVACDAAVLRVDVHDGSGDLPVLDIAPGGRGDRPGAPARDVAVRRVGFLPYRRRQGRVLHSGATARADLKIGQLTDVSHCNFQQHLFRNRRRDR